MTPRKELFIKVSAALNDIPELELIDLDRKQFSSKEGIPQIWTAALIKIAGIKWEMMVESKQEGKGVLEVTLYCKDGWMDQAVGTADPDHGLIEIDLIDKIIEKLHLLKGDYFKPLQQADDEPGDEDDDGIMSYKIRFNFTLYRRIESKYVNRNLT